MSATLAPLKIDRPDVVFDAAKHVYYLNGERVVGVSSVAKVIGFEETWGIASAWGFRVGYEGTWDRLESAAGRYEGNPWQDKDALRAELKDHKLTPWDTRDRAADRGTWVHDVLEGLAESGTVPEGEDWTDEVRGHVRAIMRWFLAMRPVFVATEVLVASRTHRFAGRYDFRCLVPGERLRAHLASLEVPLDHLLPSIPYDAQRDLYLILGDLKTSKGIFYGHMVQAEGYEVAGTEMGYAPTDARMILQTQPDGAWRFEPSHARPESFLACLTAYREAEWMKGNDPAEILKRKRDNALLAALPGTSRALADRSVVPGWDSRTIGRRMGTLRKHGLVEQGKGGVWARVD